MADIISTEKTNIDLNIVNSIAKHHLFNLIEFCEKKYNLELEVIANNILISGKKFVLLAGPSSSGKTTTSKKLCEYLEKVHRPAVSISLDDFFMDRSTYTKLPDGTYDFETFDILDVKEFNKCIKELLEKHETDLPEFDFITGSRLEHRRHLTVTDANVIIIEGIHALNPNLLQLDDSSLDYFYKLYVCVYSNFKIDDNSIIPAKLIRFMRRMLRDSQTRGIAVEETIREWDKVCAGEEKNIKPYRQYANYQLDTTHPYEPLLYHTYLEKILEKNQNSEYGKELYTKLQKCGYLDESIVPDESLLWEFLVKGKNTKELI